MKTMRSPAVLFAALGMAVVSIACVSDPGRTAKNEKDAFGFYLVEESAWADLSAYIRSHPDYQTHQKKDGTFEFLPEYKIEGALILGYYKVNGRDEEEAFGLLAVKPKPILTGRAVADASLVNEPGHQSQSLRLTLSGFTDDQGRPQDGKELFRRFTETNIDKYLAVVYKNRIVYFAPIKKTVADGRVQIACSCSAATARAIVKTLMGGE